MSPLREELQRLADTVPTGHPPEAATLWRDAARSRHRDRGLILAGAVAAIALVAGLIAWTPGLTGPEPAQGEFKSGLPDRIYAIPEHVANFDSEDGFTGDSIEHDFKLGVSAVAFTATTSAFEGLPVVIDGHGDYHLLDLPGFLKNDRLSSIPFTQDLQIALSPDGTKLAYGYADFGPDSDNEPIPSGVRIIDLVTGKARSVPLVGKEGTAVARLSWSPDSQWLVWSGWRLGSWTRNSTGAMTPVAGRIDPAVRPVDEIPKAPDPASDSSFAISNQGIVFFAEFRRISRWDGDARSRVSYSRPDTGSAALSLDSTRLALGGIASGNANYQAGANTLGQITIADPITGRGRSLTLVDDSQRNIPLGWLDGDTLLVETQRDFADDAEVPAGGRLLLLSTDGSHDEIGRIDDPDIGHLTVAYALIDPADPTYAASEPDWPWSGAHWLALALVSLAVLFLLGWLWLKRRGPNPSSPNRWTALLSVFLFAAAPLAVGTLLVLSFLLRESSALIPRQIGAIGLLSCLAVVGLAARSPFTPQQGAPEKRPWGTHVAWFVTGAIVAAAVVNLLALPTLMTGNTESEFPLWSIRGIEVALAALVVWAPMRRSFQIAFIFAMAIAGFDLSFTLTL